MYGQSLALAWLSPGGRLSAAQSQRPLATCATDALRREAAAGGRRQDLVAGRRQHDIVSVGVRVVQAQATHALVEIQRLGRAAPARGVVALLLLCARGGGAGRQQGAGADAAAASQQLPALGIGPDSLWSRSRSRSWLCGSGARVLFKYHIRARTQSYISEPGSSKAISLVDPGSPPRVSSGYVSGYGTPKCAITPHQVV